jgi:effector-binding domain-containing protein
LAVKPEVVSREAQPYASITNRVPMQNLGEELPPQVGEVFGWLAARGVQPAGPPFWKYNKIDMEGELEVEVGVPTAEEVSGDERVQGHLLPAGRYVMAQHVGHPDELREATAELLDWAETRGLRWDKSPSAEGELWSARVEEYLTDPIKQPDMNKWQTNLIFKLAD